jgi:PPOX class probable FMN-dependent enzyme
MRMPSPTWRPSLDRALEGNSRSHQHRFVQLATVRPDGRPAVRTLVFRGFLGDSSDMVFTTDARSAKCAEIRRSPEAEICWYFAGTREQFRLYGGVRLVDASLDEHLHEARVLHEARRDTWRALSDETRASFAWPTPGEPRDPGFAFPTTPPDAETPLDSFALIVFWAREVDHLVLDGNPQHRWKYVADSSGRWSGQEVNP